MRFIRTTSSTLPQEPNQVNLPEVPLDDMFRANARVDYSFYVEYVHDGMYVHGKHTRYICKKLEEVEAGKIRNLMIFMPPQTGKSMTVSESFPSWFLGRNPERLVLEVSYGDELAEQFGKRNKQKIINYGQELFGVRLPSFMSGGTSSKDWTLEKFDYQSQEYKLCRGGMVSRAIGGQVAGKGANLLIIDDPIKNAEEAASITYRNKVWNEYQAVLIGRVHPTGAKILITTRWNVDDLAGRILKEEKGWEVIDIPALAEDNDLIGREKGQAIFPERGYDETWAKEKKESVGSKVWASLYQQHPKVGEGTVFKREWMNNLYRELPRILYKVQSWDTGLKEGKANDPSCRQTWAKCANGYYLISRSNKKLEFPDLCRSIKTQYAAENLKGDPVHKVIIEDAVSGTSAYQVLKKETNIALFSRGTGGRSKELRAESVSPLFEAGKIFLPDPTFYENCEWLEEVIESWCAFPDNGIHDEDVDCTSQALEELRTIENRQWVRTSEDHPKLNNIDKGIPIHKEGNGHKPEQQDRYTEKKIEDKVLPHYFDLGKASTKDTLLAVCKDQGYVPYTCLLGGSIVMGAVRENKDPCEGCSGERSTCRGRG